MSVPTLYLGLKLAGAFYLIYLAVRLWREAGEPLRVPDFKADQGGNLPKAVWIGLATQLSNPKTAVVYASIFSAFLPGEAPRWVAFVVVPMIIIIEAGWYSLVALIFSAERPRRNYLRSKLWLDRLAGGILGLLGLKMITEGR